MDSSDSDFSDKITEDEECWLENEESSDEESVDDERNTKKLDFEKQGLKTAHLEEEKGAYQETQLRDDVRDHKNGRNDEEEENKESEDEEEKGKAEVEDINEEDKGEEERDDEEEEASTEEIEDAYELRISAAYQDVISKARSIRAASHFHSVAYSTLQNRVKNGNVAISAGRRKYLTEEEEKVFASYCIFRAVRACPLSREEILDAIQDSLNKVGRKSKFQNNRPSKKWFNLFQKRHNLSLRKPEELDGGRTRVKSLINIFFLLMIKPNLLFRLMNKAYDFGLLILLNFLRKKIC